MARHTLQYQPTNDGIAIGKAHVIAATLPPTPHYWIADHAIDNECERFRQALQLSCAQVSAMRDKLCQFQGDDHRSILDAHILFLQDPSLDSSTCQYIAQHFVNAEWALEKVIGQYLGALGASAQSAYLRERHQDIEQLGQRIMRNLIGAPERVIHAAPYAATILFAPDLSPAETVALSRRKIRGFVTIHGGRTSHTAILARSMDFPAIIGAHDIFDHVQEGDTVVIDAEQGVVCIAPSAKELAQYKKLQQEQAKEKRALRKERHYPAVSIDGFPLTLCANIELLDEVPIALEHGAAGIGMYRTEYMFMHRPEPPSEEEQYQQYRRTIEQMAPRPVTIRTLDIGGDKIAGFHNYEEPGNPALGLRAIRFCLREREIFLTQLRALYRASIHGELRILFPLISGLGELRAVRECIQEVWDSLAADHLPYDDRVPIGIMIEVPSAVMLADQFAREVDFFSIGTNDLTQYTLAVDRNNEHVSYLYHALHPAVLRMIHHTVCAAKKRHIEVSVCGEMAGDPNSILPLLGLELNQLSMNSVSIPKVKRLIRRCRITEVRALAAQALQLSTPQEVKALIEQRLTNLL